MIDVTSFSACTNPTQSTNPNYSGYPNQWTTPHWGGSNSSSPSNYNPHLAVGHFALGPHPDGTRAYYDPITHSYSYEHSSGYHYAVLQDAVIENVPGKKLTHVGGGGWDVTIHGHHDFSTLGHARYNYGADTYHNTKGVAHHFNAGLVHINTGNEKHVHYGDVAHTILGPGSFGIGVGPGDGTNHDNALTVTNKRIYIRAYTGGDIYIQTKNNDVVINCGNTINISASANININAPNGTITANASSAVINTSQNATVSAQGSVSITGQGGISLSSPKTISISGNPTVINGYSGGPYTPPWFA